MADPTTAGGSHGGDAGNALNVQLRAGSSRTADGRAVDTRRRLAVAFAQAAERQVRDLTVMELCRLAQVGRSTFYTHYATVDDLAVSLVGELFTTASPIDLALRSEGRRRRQEITRQSLEQLVDVMWENRVLIVYALGLPNGQTITRRITDGVADVTRVEVLAERHDLPEAEARLLALYFAGGFVQLIVGWLARPEVDRATVVEHLFSVLPAWVSTAPRD